MMIYTALALLLAVAHGSSSEFMSAIEQRADLDSDSMVFDFLGQAPEGESSLIPAIGSTFKPAALGGVAVAWVTIQPCEMNLPHIHPRGAEFATMISGEELTSGVVGENGEGVINTVLKPGMGTIFFQGLPHFQINTGCEPAMFIASFPDADPGALTFTTQIGMFDKDALSQAFGLSVEDIKDMVEGLPSNFAPPFERMLDQCRKRCGRN